MPLQHNDEPPPILRIHDDMPRCSKTTHAWRVNFDWGDTCECRQFYLLRAPDLTIRVERTFDPED